jgi:hypothetical protein
MRWLLVAVAWAAVGILVVAPAPTRSTTVDARYARAHAAAVRYRAERDDLQERLAVRVREAHALRRALVHEPSSVEALRLAAVVYRVEFRLAYRIASCESTGARVGSGPVSERTLSARAKNPRSTARGLAQALDSTWASSIFAGFSPYSPYASAMFIGHEISLGHLWQWDASRSCWS